MWRDEVKMHNTTMASLARIRLNTDGSVAFRKELE